MWNSQSTRYEVPCTKNIQNGEKMIKIDNYRLLDIIAETNYARLYKAVKCIPCETTAWSSWDAPEGIPCETTAWSSWDAPEGTDLNQYSEDELLYAVKEYLNGDMGEAALEKEKRISHHIENHASKSIVIPILSTIKYNDKEYAIMQYKKNGMFLSETINQLEARYGVGSIPVNIVLNIIEEILTSIKIFHSFENGKGYLHLDIHPANIFFESAEIEANEIGKAKFIDFYNSIQIENGTINDKMETIRCAISEYASPEQLEGEVRKFCRATDLYSIAAIFVRLLQGKCTEKIKKKNGTIWNSAADAFFMCAMNYNPKYRFESAEEMIAALDRLRKLAQANYDLDYFKLLSISYDMFLPEIDNKMTNLPFLEDKFKVAVKKLEDDLKVNIIEIAKCYYIFSALWAMAENVWDNLKSDVKNQLICSGIACCNHMGRTEQAIELFEKLQETKTCMPLLEYLSLINRAAVMYADTCYFQKANDLIVKNINGLERIKEAYEKVAIENQMDGKNATKMKELGRAYSALGTYKTILKNGNALELFQKALMEFGDDIGNRTITISHILGYAIEKQDKALFQKYFTEYYGRTDSMEECLKHILCGRIDLYKLYVYLKGIYVFEERLKDRLIKMISDLLYEKRLKDSSYHPVELIYKYIGLILYKITGKVDAKVEEAMYLSITCIENGKVNLNCNINILMCITYQTMSIFNHITEQEDENEYLVKVFRKHCETSGWHHLIDSLDSGKPLEQLLNYEYS
mgnify:CR=1 FL=1